MKSEMELFIVQFHEISQIQLFCWLLQISLKSSVAVELFPIYLLQKNFLLRVICVFFGCFVTRLEFCAWTSNHFT